MDGIYLCPSKNQQGGHEVMHLNTEKLIYPMEVTAISVTDLVIKAVEEMRERQGVKV